MKMNNLLNKVTRKYFRNLKFYLRILLNQFSNLCEYPIYYTKEYLNIIKSTLSFFLLEFPNFKSNRIIRKINGVNYPFYFNYAPRYRGMYMGLNSMPTVKVLLKNIKKGTTFIDAGANIGYLSAIGSSLVGKKGSIHSFEPVPAYFKKLSEMAHLNKKYQIFINSYALGNTPGKSSIYISKNTIGSNTLISGLYRDNSIKETIEVNVKRLDDYIYENNIKNISLIKIDVEGFELILIEGLIKYFEESKKNRPPIVMEISPSVYSLLGRTLEDLDDIMKSYGYSSYRIDEKFKIDIKKLITQTDVVFKL